MMNDPISYLRIVVTCWILTMGAFGVQTYNVIQHKMQVKELQEINTKCINNLEICQGLLDTCVHAIKVEQQISQFENRFINH